MIFFNRILNLKLRIKLLLAFGSLLALNILMMTKVFLVSKESERYTAEVSGVERLYINILEMERAAKVFIYEGFKSTDFQKEGKSVTLDSYVKNLDTARQRVATLREISGDADSSINKINRRINLTSSQFKNLTDLLKERGFKDYGLEGKLRAAIHQAENSGFKYDKADMLMLRRHEKDFFLRKDIKYLNEFNKKADSFIGSLQEQPASRERDDILAQVNDYKTLFNEVVALDEKIGLQDNGLKGKLDNSFTELKSFSQQLIYSITDCKENYARNSSILLMVIFLVQMVIGIVLAIVYADQITRAVKELRQAIRSFAAGTFPSPLTVKSKEEIGQTKEAFNQLLERIKAAQDFSLAMGEGNMTNVYRSEFKDDLLAKALIRTQQELKRAHEEQEKINWTNSGLAKLNQLLKADDKDLASLGDDILKLLVQYLEMNQGALYIVHTQENTSWAERISTYAYGKRKIEEQRVEAGQGLIGQCLLEKETILITEVPKNYVRITSGLGDATPRFIQITPLVSRDEVVGILELASFQKLEDFKIEFVKAMAKNVAVILHDKQTALETRKLLDESRSYAQQLVSQEEEIRQNAEEMQAITEQLEREKKQLQSEVDVLRSMIKTEMVKN